MRASHRSPSSPRPAFTLVELMVVIVIIAALAGLAVLLVPQLQDSQRVAKGADTVQGALFMAKQMALRDQQPRGVRLVVNPADGLVHSLQFIEQPPYYAPTGSFLMGVQLTADPSNPNNFLALTGYFNGPPPPNNLDFFAGNPGNNNQSIWPVQPGDYLELIGYNKPDALYLITGVQASGFNGAGKGDSLTLATSLPTNMLPTPLNAGTAQYQSFQYVTLPNGTSLAWRGLPYRIVRGPRAMLGSQPINLPADVVVDVPAATKHALGTNCGSQVQADSQTNQVDIMFDSSGKVLRTAGQNGKVILWVYDPTGNPAAGDQTLVTVYTRTGTIASHPVNVNSNVGGGDPYWFVKDGSSSGM
jgi:prepilin-type N-terminal cleavage/methylation domain-containing protein